MNNAILLFDSVLQSDGACVSVRSVYQGTCLQIDQLEKEQMEYQKHMKAVEWAKLELQSATSANSRWKELCDQLQQEMAEAATANLAREQELQHTVAERNQQILTLRVSQVPVLVPFSHASTGQEGTVH